MKSPHARHPVCRAAAIPLLITLIVLHSPRAGSEDRTSSSRHGITFVQLTDAHIFDEGWKQSTADALREAADDWTALHWAIQEINGLVSSGTQVDFVVYTGDLGLQNVDFPRTRDCRAIPLQLEPGLPPSTLLSAVK